MGDHTIETLERCLSACAGALAVLTQIALSNVGVEFGATRIFEGITFTIGEGDRWAILGRNGSGKTTLFRLITGTQQPTRRNDHAPSGTENGAARAAPRLRRRANRVGSRRRRIRRACSRSSTRWRNRETSSPRSARPRPPQMLARYDRDLERFDREGGYTFAPRVDAVLPGTRLRCRESAHAAAVAAERRRARQARPGATAGERRRCPAARRADQSPRSRDHALARGLSQEYAKDDSPHQPRPRVSGERRRSCAAPRGRQRRIVHRRLRILRPAARGASAQPAARLREAAQGGRR